MEIILLLLINSAIVNLLEFRRRHISAVLVDMTVVEPVDIISRGSGHVIDATPRPPGLDQLGLVEAIDGFRESIIVSVADYPDRRCYSFPGEPFSEPQRRILAPCVIVMYKSLETIDSVAFPRKYGLATAASTSSAVIDDEAFHPRMRRA